MTDANRDILNRLILVQCRLGKTEGFETLVRTWQKPLLYYIRRLVEREEDVLDVMQDVWVRALGGIRSLRSHEAMPTWLYRIAHNTAMSHLRKRGRWETNREDIEVLDAVEVGADEAPQFAASEIHEALSVLPLLEREVLTLHFLEGYEVTEIAEITEAPVGTVKSRMFRAKRNLRQVLEKGERLQ